jgi:hypothetical protein
MALFAGLYNTKQQAQNRAELHCSGTGHLMPRVTNFGDMNRCTEPMADAPAGLDSHHKTLLSAQCSTNTGL